LGSLIQKIIAGGAGACYQFGAKHFADALGLFLIVQHGQSSGYTWFTKQCRYSKKKADPISKLFAARS
jgi:hypothetical protein